MKASGATSTAPPVEQTLGSLRLEDVVQGVVERAQVGIDLRHQIAGKEPQALPGLDRRPGEDDPVDLVGLQGLDGESDGQVRLSRAGGPHAERDDVAGDGVRVALLARRLRPDGLAPGRPHHLGGEDFGRAHILLDHVDGPSHLGRVESLARLEQEYELLEELPDAFGLVAVDRDLVASDDDAGATEGALDDAQELVPMPEQAGHEVVPGYEDLDG